MPACDQCRVHLGCDGNVRFPKEQSFAPGGADDQECANPLSFVIEDLDPETGRSLSEPANGGNSNFLKLAVL